MSTGRGGARVARRGEVRSRGARRLLASFADERLVALVRRGHGPAFEELFDRHCHGVLAYCSYILGSQDEGQDALQHAFLAVWQAVAQRGAEPRAFNSWLYAIARNRCLSVLRSRREAALEWEEETVAARERTDERVEQRAELREVLDDLQKLPETQRTALLLSEFGDLSHVDIASVLGCPREKVKSLVFQARSSLARRSEARDTPCLEVREELASSPESRLPLALRRHLKGCEGCGAFATEIRRQRRLVALALPLASCPGLKRSVLGAVGAGGQAGGKGGLMAGLAAKGALTSAGGAGVGGGGVAGGGFTAGVAAGTGFAKAASAGLAVVTLAGAGLLAEKPPLDPSRSVASAASEDRGGAPEKEALSVPAPVSHDNPARTGRRLESQGEPEPSPGTPGSGGSNEPSSEAVPGGGQSGTPQAQGRSPGQGIGAVPRRGEPSSGVVVAGGRARSRGAEGRSPGQGAGGGSQRREPDGRSRQPAAQRPAPGRERTARPGPSGRHPADLARVPAKAGEELRECLAILRDEPRRESRCAKTPRVGRPGVAGLPEKPGTPRRLGPRRHERPGLP